MIVSTLISNRSGAYITSFFKCVQLLRSVS